jgi:histidinol-phosphate aminotransferase
VIWKGRSEGRTPSNAKAAAMTGIEFNRHIEDIPIYPAASTYAFEGELVKLASNETPFAPHPQVLEVVESQLRTLNRYPDPEKSLLRRRISERTGVPIGNVAVGNGSCEILLAAATAMLEPGAELVYAWPAFSMYPQLAAMSGATAVTVPLTETGEHDLEAMAAQVTAATRLVIVCNPNNPTATALPPAAIDAWVAELPRHVAVIVDEAYVEFSALQDPDDSLDLVGRHPNLVLLRTFSKVYGLCGLRAGYALGPESFRLAVDRVRQPFSVNALAQAAAAEAINHQDEVERRVEQNVIERVHVEGELEARGLQTTDSQANFSWVSLGDRDEDAIVEGLARQGVIVRAGKALGEEGRLRVTYGSRSENDRFLVALDSLL